MHTTLLISQIILSSLLTGAVLLQSNGTGLAGSWSGGGETYHTKRGIERVMFIATIIITVLFLLNALAILLVRS